MNSGPFNIFNTFNGIKISGNVKKTELGLEVNGTIAKVKTGYTTQYFNLPKFEPGDVLCRVYPGSEVHAH